MVPWRATDDGFVTERNLDWYGRFAEGRPGVLVIEATGIRDIPSGPLLRLGDDRFVEGMQRLVERVRDASGGETRLLIQLIDFLSMRRRPEPERFFRSFLVVTDRHRDALADLLSMPHLKKALEEEVRSSLITLPEEHWQDVLTARELDSLRLGSRERITDVELPHIAELPQTLPPLFAAAARRAREAGFDGVELHYAHAYTMASFLSRMNTRADGYGGSLEGRTRLPLEVFKAVRQEVGSDFTVGCRMLTDEIIAGGSRVDDATFFATSLARAGMDFISLSRGGKFEDARQPRVGKAIYPYTGPSGAECMPTIRIDETGPFGRNVPDTGVVRGALREMGSEIPVVVAGGLCSFSQVEALLQDRVADFIGAARQSLADPDWWSKMRRGDGASVRRCAYTNYCEGLDQAHKAVTCRLWDRLPINDREPDPALETDGRRLLPPPLL
jgi:2,4-dienoyl-CoA reductase-like NADH-dependent reductase (Old Yellow Enzyme family)